ncbi:MAG: hypothetical protein QXX87_05435 [Candidatus Jordarchaeales archaeon]
MRRGEVLRQWLEKWYAPSSSVGVSGYLFIKLSDIEEAVEVLKSNGDAVRFFTFFKGDILSPEVREATQRLLRAFSSDVFLSPLVRGDLTAIVIVEYYGSKVCAVGYGREKWLCVFKTREKEMKMVMANVFSLLGYSERPYELSGTKILAEGGVSNWVRSLLERGEVEYGWVRDYIEAGTQLPKDLNLIVKTVQNLFESPFFAFSVFSFLDQKSGRGAWCLKYSDEISCIISGLASESYSREMAETLAEIYDCYASGIVGLKEKEVVTQAGREVTRVGGGEVVVEKGEVEVGRISQQDILEVKKVVREVNDRLDSIERRVSAIEGKMSSLATSNVQNLTYMLDEKLKLIDEAISRIRELMVEFSERLQELRRHKADLLRTIEELSR